MSTRALVTLFAIPLLALVGLQPREERLALGAGRGLTRVVRTIHRGTSGQHAASPRARERLAQLAEEKDWRTAAERTRSRRISNSSRNTRPASGPRKRRCASTISRAGCRGRRRGSRRRRGAGQDPPQPAARSADADAPRPPVAASGFGVQLGAFSSAERANDEWKKLQAGCDRNARRPLAARRRRRGAGKNASIACRREVRDEAQARAICGGLKVAKKPCVPVIPPRR